MMEKNNILLIHAQWLKDNGYKYKDCLDQATNYNKKIDKRQTKLKRTSVQVTPRASLCTAICDLRNTVGGRFGAFAPAGVRARKLWGLV